MTDTPTAQTRWTSEQAREAWSHYPHHLWWNVEGRGSDEIFFAPPPNEDTVAIFREADTWLQEYPILARIYELAKIGKRMLLHHDPCVEQLTSLWKDYQVPAELTILTARVEQLEPNDPFRKWAMDLVHKVNLLKPCQRCGKYRRVELMKETDEGFFCNTHLTNGDRSCPETLIENCYMKHALAMGNENWLSATRCFTCKEPASNSLPDEVMYNVHGEIIGAVCHICRVMMHRHFHQVKSTIPKHIQEAIDQAPGIDRNPYIG